MTNGPTTQNLGTSLADAAKRIAAVNNAARAVADQLAAERDAAKPPPPQTGA